MSTTIVREIYNRPGSTFTLMDVVVAIQFMLHIEILYMYDLIVVSCYQDIRETKFIK